MACAEQHGYSEASFLFARREVRCFQHRPRLLLTEETDHPLRPMANGMEPITDIAQSTLNQKSTKLSSAHHIA